MSSRKICAAIALLVAISWLGVGLCSAMTGTAPGTVWGIAIAGAALTGALGASCYLQIRRFGERLGRMSGHKAAENADDIGSDLQRKDSLARTAAALAKSERREKIAFQATFDLIFRIDLEGMLLDIQGQHNYDLNLPREKLVGKKISQLLSQKVAVQIMRYVRETLRTGMPQEFEGQLLLPGKRRYYKTRMVACDRDVVAVVRETTEQKTMEAKLSVLKDKMEQRVSQLALSEKALVKQTRILQSVLDSIGDGMIVADTNGNFLLVNPAAEKIMGMDLLGSTIHDWTDLWDCYLCDGITPCPCESLPLARAVLGEEIDDAEIFLMRKASTRVLWLNINGRPLKDVSGGLKGGVILFRDITERKRAEAALLQSEAKNRALLNAIPDLMLLIRKDGTFLACVAAKDDESGTMSGDIIGQKVNDVFPKEVADHIMYYAAQAIESGEPQIFEYQMSQNNEMCDYEARLVTGMAGEALAIVRDITDRKKVERMKNEFISTVSHELRTPLTSIRGSLGLIVGGLGGPLSEQGKNLAHIALNNTDRLVRLINDILDIQKIESGKMAFHRQWIKLAPLLEQAIESNRSYGQQYGVEFVIENHLPKAEIKTDSDRLMQVMTNLLSNAAKFSPRGEKVEISVAILEKVIRVSVADRGPGIPPEFRGRIFQKFAQADSSDSRQKGGTGLGLSIAKSIIERLGGQINFESQLNVGSTFYFDLPEWRGEEVPSGK